MGKEGGQMAKQRGAGALRETAAEFLRGMTRAELGLYAASGAYFLFLSLIPLAALLCSLLPLTPLTRESVLGYLSPVLPEVVEALLREILDQVYESSPAAFSLSALLTLWSASKAFVGLIQGLDRIYGSPPPRGFLRLRALSGLYTLALLCIMLLSLLFALSQRRLIRLLAAAWPQGSELLASLLRLRYLLIMVLLALYFALLYAFLPARRPGFVHQLPGAMLTALLWMLLAWLFGRYVQGLGGVTLYGSLARVILALFWVYLCMYLILLGAYCNMWLKKVQNAG